MRVLRFRVQKVVLSSYISSFGVTTIDGFWKLGFNRNKSIRAVKLKLHSTALNVSQDFVNRQDSISIDRWIFKHGPFISIKISFAQNIRIEWMWSFNVWNSWKILWRNIGSTILPWLKAARYVAFKFLLFWWFCWQWIFDNSRRIFLVLDTWISGIEIQNVKRFIRFINSSETAVLSMIFWRLSAKFSSEALKLAFHLDSSRKPGNLNF